MFNSPSASRRKRFTVPSSNMPRNTSDLFKCFSDWEGNLPLQTCDSYTLIGCDLVERTFLFIPNVQYLIQKKVWIGDLKNASNGTKDLCKILLQNGEKLRRNWQLLKVGFGDEALSQSTGVNGTIARGWESWVKTFVPAAGPCHWQQKSTQSNPYRVQIGDQQSEKWRKT